MVQIAYNNLNLLVKCQNLKSFQIITQGLSIVFSS